MHISDSSGWTHVVRGQRIGHSRDGHQPILEAQPFPDGMTVPNLVEKQKRYETIWRSSQCCNTLMLLLKNDILSSKNFHITQCICLGLGSISAGRASSNYELAALVVVLEILAQ